MKKLGFKREITQIRAGSHSAATIAALCVALLTFFILESVGLLVFSNLNEIRNTAHTLRVLEAKQRLDSVFKKEIDRVTLRARWIAMDDATISAIQGTDIKSWITDYAQPILNDINTPRDADIVALIGGGEKPIVVRSNSWIDKNVPINNKEIKKGKLGGSDVGLVINNNKLLIRSIVPVVLPEDITKIYGVLLIARHLDEIFLEELLKTAGAKNLTILGNDWVNQEYVEGYIQVPINGNDGKLLASALFDLPVKYRTFDFIISTHGYLALSLIVAVLSGLIVWAFIQKMITIPLRGLILAKKTPNIENNQLAAEVNLVKNEIDSIKNTLDAVTLDNQQLRALLPVGLQIIKGDQTLEVNEVMCNMAGVSKEYFLTANPFFYLDGDALIGATSFLNMLKSDEFLVKTGFDAEIKRSGAPAINVMLRLAVHESETNGRLLYVMIVDRNFIKNETRDNLDKDRQLSEFAKFGGGVAHNINNLLTGILGATSILKSPLKKDSPETTAKMINTIQQSAEKCAELSKELLIISQLRDGRTSRSPVDACRLFQEAVNTCSGIQGVEGIIFKSFIPRGEAIVLADESGLYQVIQNIIFNSIDAIEESGEIISTLKIQSGDNGPEAVLIICDNGKGIPTEIMDRLFEPFFSTKKKNSTIKKQLGGTGLGLSTAKTMVESWGGEIVCKSTTGVGTEFQIILPLALAHLSGTYTIQSPNNY